MKYDGLSQNQWDRIHRASKEEQLKHWEEAFEQMSERTKREFCQFLDDDANVFDPKNIEGRKKQYRKWQRTRARRRSK